MTLQEERAALQKRMDEIDDVLYGEEKKNFVPGWYMCCDDTSQGFQCYHFDFEEYKLVQGAWNHIEPLHTVVQNFLPEGWRVVGPESKTLYDWSQAPEWAKWAATDKDGRVWWYNTEPKASHQKWLGENSYIESTLPSPSVPWDQSLEQRPGITQ